MQEITSKKLKDMLILGGETLGNSHETINALNVFPVPDGDTGTNMNMTIQSGVKNILNLETESPHELLKSFSKGLLLGARGNSGVILSQFFRGFAEGFEEKDQINVVTFSEALKSGKKRAYESVIKAVEGTILTVINDMSELKYEGEDFLDYFNTLLDEGQRSLDNTPNLLPVLKEVGVVDSGGAGLLEVFKGMQSSLTGQEVKNILGSSFEAFKQTEEHPLDVNDITFGYCTEMLIELEQEIDIKDVRDKLETLGDSIVAIEDEGILKTHVHTEEPMTVFDYGKSLGDFVHIKSENMRVQAKQAQGEKKEVENAIVAVCSSQDMSKVFSKIQKIEPIIGGQTLNPSTEELVQAIKNTNAKNVLILPNNSNVIMAAQSAIELVEDKNIKIVKTKHMTQCFECLVNYDETLSLEENVEVLEESLENLVNYEVTKAIKDTSIDGIEIKNEDFLILKDGKIITSITEEEEVFNYLKKEINIDDSEIVSVFLGENSSPEIVETFCEDLENLNDFLETKVFTTNQPVYNYLISVLEE